VISARASPLKPAHAEGAVSYQQSAFSTLSPPSCPVADG
jgi:hypothetical protein